MKAIADTGAIYALIDEHDRWHDECKRVLEEKKLELILPSSTLPEICYLVNKYLGTQVEIDFVRSITEGEVKVEEVNLEDYRKALSYLEKYKDLNIGFVDATVISIAERLKIYTLFTIDRRHFSQIEIEKGKFFSLLP